MKYWLSESLVIVKIKYSRKQRCAWKELVILFGSIRQKTGHCYNWC